MRIVCGPLAVLRHLVLGAALLSAAGVSGALTQSARGGFIF